MSSFPAIWVLCDLSSKHSNSGTIARFLLKGTLMIAVNAKYKCPFRSPSEPCERCSSSLPQAQSTVVLIKLCAAFLTSSPMVILGYSQCEGGCKPTRHPIRAFISPYRLILLIQTHLDEFGMGLSLIMNGVIAMF